MESSGLRSATDKAPQVVEDGAADGDSNGAEVSLSQESTTSAMAGASTTAIQAGSFQCHGGKGEPSSALQRKISVISGLSKTIKTGEGLGDRVDLKIAPTLPLTPGPGARVASIAPTTSITQPMSDALPTSSEHSSTQRSLRNGPRSQHLLLNDTLGKSVTTTTLEQTNKTKEDNSGPWSWPLGIFQRVSSVIAGKRPESEVHDKKADYEENSYEAGHEDSAAVKQLKSLQRLIEQRSTSNIVPSGANKSPIAAAPARPAQLAAASRAPVKAEPIYAGYIVLNRGSFSTPRRTSSSAETPLSRTFRALLQDIGKREDPPNVPEATYYIPSKISATGSSLAGSASTARPRSSSPPRPSSARSPPSASTEKREDPPIASAYHGGTSRHVSGVVHSGSTRSRLHGRGLVNHCLANRVSNNAHTPPSGPNSIHSHRSSAWSPSTTSRSSFNTSAGSWQSVQRAQSSRNRWSPIFPIVYPHSNSSNPSPRQNSDPSQHPIEAHSPAREYHGMPIRPPPTTLVTRNRQRRTKSTSGSPVSSGNSARTNQLLRQQYRRRPGSGSPSNVARQVTNVHARHAQSGLATPPVLPMPNSQPTSFREGTVLDLRSTIASYLGVSESCSVCDSCTSHRVHKNSATYSGCACTTPEESRGTDLSDRLLKTGAVLSRESDSPLRTNIRGQANILDSSAGRPSFGLEDEDDWMDGGVLLSGIEQNPVNRLAPLQNPLATVTRANSNILFGRAETLPQQRPVNERRYNLQAKCASRLGNNSIREEEEGNEE